MVVVAFIVENVWIIMVNSAKVNNQIRNNIALNPPAKVRDISAASGLLPQKFKTFPLSADCSCRSAGGFRSQRIAAAELQDVSAISGCCRKSAVRFRWQRIVAAKVQEVFEPSEMLLHFCRKVFTLLFGQNHTV